MIRIWMLCFRIGEEDCLGRPMKSSGKEAGTAAGLLGLLNRRVALQRREFQCIMKKHVGYAVRKNVPL